MLRVTLPIFSALAACTPPAQETAMRSPDPIREISDRASREIRPEGQGSAITQAGDRQQAAMGPVPEPVSAAANPLPAPAPAPDSPAEARGRSTLSTAFVMVGPDGHLTVEQRGGGVLVLRDVVMRAKDYCGVQVFGGSPGARYCGEYADVAAARPGRGPTP